MKTIIYVLFLTLCGFLVIGWFLDWYSVQDVRSSPGKHRLEIEIDTDKIRQDLERGRKKLEDTWRRVKTGEEQVQTQPGLGLRLAQK
ncbi:MAG: hypothetical protein NZM42_07445 [Gemmatales bacterium]|nr:hypothetical protein [Gemmatales bacterium]MDW8222553.1 hypothetical protein [Gemmatales bacterium]